MGLDDQVTCYSSTSAGAVNHCDGSDRSMEPEQERLMQTEELNPGSRALVFGFRAVLSKDLLLIPQVFFTVLNSESEETHS